MKRSYRRFMLLAICLLMAVPSIASASTNANAYSEGIHVKWDETHHQSTHAELHATKRVDGQWAQSEIHLKFDYAYVDGERHIDATAILEGDPDWLEVSEDLGWGGLDGVVWMPMRRIDCTFNTSGARICNPEVTQNVPVEIHLALWATESFKEAGGLFTRNARVEGTVKIADREQNLTFGQGLFANGYNFSDQYPR